jgi:hypothetical protein
MIGTLLPTGSKFRGGFRARRAIGGPEWLSGQTQERQRRLAPIARATNVSDCRIRESLGLTQTNRLRVENRWKRGQAIFD